MFHESPAATADMSVLLYEPEAGRPWALVPATYCSSTPRIQPPAVARSRTLLHGLATAIHETSGLGVRKMQWAGGRSKSRY